MLRLAINGRFHAARPTGVQRVARELVAALAQRAEVTLYMPGGGAPAVEAHARLRVERGILRGVLWEQVELPARAPGRGRVLALDPANAGPGWGGRRVLILHDVFPLTHPHWYGPAFRAWFHAAVVPAARRAARVVMFSRWARAQAARALGIDRGRIAVVTQGAGPFDAPPPPAEVRATLGRLGLQPGYVLAGGAGDRRKNTPFLLEVMHRLAARGGVVPELVLTGAPYGHVHAPEPPAAGPPAVRRLGFVTDRELSALYAGAGVFCFPSLAEGFGRPPLEALACGAPVVAADYGSASEVLGGAATILPLHAERWADAVTAALQSGQGRSRRITVGRAHAAAFQWGQAADQILAVCRAALPAPSLVARQAHAAGRPAGG